MIIQRSSQHTASARQPHGTIAQTLILERQVNNMQTNQAYKKHTNTKARKSYQEAMPKGKANKPARGKERVL